MGWISATLTTTSGWPLSTAESTANTIASSRERNVERGEEHGPSAGGDERDVFARTAAPDGRHATRGGASSAARSCAVRRYRRRQYGRKKKSQTGHHDRDQEDEVSRSRRRSAEPEPPMHGRRDREHLDLVAPHPAQQALVLLGRDLLRVPRASTRARTSSAGRRPPASVSPHSHVIVIGGLAISVRLYGAAAGSTGAVY